ncbi:LRP4 [Mytilus coruscus]|uniref:LRP4 n=1 Tax=Mytilus coruscus TaxID=42192 RepID=A0A6J8BL89_MYTCO|nr:LRP4 [Mytilus coruscus]
MDVRVWFNICLICYHTLAAESVCGKLLFATTQSIMEVDVDTQSVTELVELGGIDVMSLDYDYENKYVYFPRIQRGDIVRFHYPSQNITLQHVVNTSFAVVVGIAVDSANDHVYWVTDSGNTLSRCKSDGTNLVVFNCFSGTVKIRLDVKNRWMYIVYYNKGISKSRLNTTDIGMIVNFTSSNTVWVDTMDIDLKEQRLYWMNTNGDIKSADVVGYDVKTIISINSFSIAIGVSDSCIYFANNTQLFMTTKSQDSTPTVLYNDNNTIYTIYAFTSTGMLIAI